MKSTYQLWRHHVLIFTGTFEECKAFLIKHDPEGDYKDCNRAMVTSFSEGMETYTSLQGQLWMSEYASIKPTRETQIEIDQLNTKAKIEEIDTLLTWGE